MFEKSNQVEVAKAVAATVKRTVFRGGVIDLSHPLLDRCPLTPRAPLLPPYAWLVDMNRRY